jgi:hypothetical protein
LWADEIAGPEKDGMCLFSFWSDALNGLGFTFDRVFDTTSRQDEIFNWGVKEIVEGVFGPFDGYARTLRCYRRHDWFQWHALLLWSDGIGKDF